MQGLELLEGLPSRAQLAELVERARRHTDEAVATREGRLGEAGVLHLIGRGEWSQSGELRIVEGERSGEVLPASRILLATGKDGAPPTGWSGPVPPLPPLLTGGSAERPGRVHVVGGGRRGLTWAGLLAMAASEVTVVEASERLLPDADEWLGQKMKERLTEAGVEVLLGSRACSWTGESLRLSDDRSLVTEDVVLAAGAPVQPTLPGEGGPRADLAGAAADRRADLEWAERDGRRRVARLLDRAPEPWQESALPRRVGGPARGGWTGASRAELEQAGHSLREARVESGRGELRLLADAGSQRLLAVQVVGPSTEATLAVATACVEFAVTIRAIAAFAACEGSPVELLVEAARRLR